MNRTLGALALAFSLIATPALAGPHGDALGQCLIKSTDEAGKTTLVRWMFAAMSLHPDVKPLSNISDAQRDQLNQEVATLFETLLTESCIEQTRTAIKKEGPETIENAFGVLGEVASEGLFANQEVEAGMAALEQKLDEKKFEKLFKK